jgi:hypothetical protein
MAPTLAGCVAFAYNPKEGVQFYSNQCFDEDRHLDHNSEWDTFVYNEAKYVPPKDNAPAWIQNPPNPRKWKGGGSPRLPKSPKKTQGPP